MSDRLVPLPTHDPFGGGELIVTRLSSPTTGVTFEGSFTLGWMGRLTPEQLDFVGLLLQRRNNLQKLAADLGVAYNTARARFEAIIEAVGGTPDADPDPSEATASPRASRKEILRRLAAGELTPEQARQALDA